MELESPLLELLLSDVLPESPVPSPVLPPVSPVSPVSPEFPESPVFETLQPADGKALRLH